MHFLDIKKRIILTIISIVAVSFVIVGLSYSAFFSESEGSTRTINFGDISMSLCYTEDCTNSETLYSNAIGTRQFTLHDANNQEVKVTGYVPVFPTADPVGSYPSAYSNLTPYTFTIKNTGSVSLYSSIYLQDDTSGDLSYTINKEANSTTYSSNNNGNIISGTITENNDITTIQTFSQFVTSQYYKYFKVAILEDGTSTPTVTTFDQIVNNDYMLADNITLSPNQTRRFHIYIWLSEDLLIENANSANPDTTTNTIQGKYFVTNVFAKGEYIPE